MILNAAARHRLKKKTFGLPGQEKYPMPDAAHARNAKARASAQYHKGKLSKAEFDKINRKADKKLGKKWTQKEG